MAEENQATGTTQEAAVDQEAPVEEADESNVEQKEESNADVEQSETEKVFSEEKNEPSENITEDTENETSTDETVSDKNLTESLDVDEEVKDGFVEEDGSVYYYEAGKKVTDTIRDFKDESGFEYSCYFDWSGRMMIDSEEWVEYTDENEKSHDGIIATNEENRISLFNPEAEKIFHRIKYEVLGKKLEDICSSINEKKLNEEEELLINIYNKQYLIKKSSIYVKDVNKGSIYSLQNISEMQKLERNIRKKLSSKGLVAKYSLEDTIGKSPACVKMKNKAKKYALTNSTILITGESGTGKEMLVQGIHNISDRAQGPFVALNCAALPENLLESELFGYVDGAFTGAKRGGRQGMFELAHGGTLFLDEMGEMPLSLQSRILRVLQEREVMPLGGESIIPIDVRIIAATNQNLSKMVEEGKFRSDLYYRLNILRIHMPTLAERKEDIPVGHVHGTSHDAVHGI